jgi:GalNAc-alpha-(1->4)-GalNAc-alpha-(1->3)-diNAcBac-PP-undecaprenol alpha-1,4-N-acetyl-D-galactosaminyltransferase
MKIALVVSSVTGGGAERVAVTLANSWSSAGHTVRLITFEPPGTSPEFELSNDIVVVQLGLMARGAGLLGPLSKNLYRILLLRRCLCDYLPDIVVSLVTAPNILAVLASFGRPWPTVISERVHPGHHPMAKPWAILRRVLYPYANSIVVQTAGIALWFRTKFGVETIVIPNPIDVEKFRVRPLASAKSRYLAIAVGRLDPQKGFDLLITAFADVAAANSKWDLVIYGEGEERLALQNLIATLGMQDRVRLAGATRDIARVYDQADLLVHPSRYEGYPNVVQEALAVGRPVVATDCPGATRELLGEGRYGVLVASNDVDALARALAAILPDKERRAALALAAPTAVVAFEADKVAQRWLELFHELNERRAKR